MRLVTSVVLAAAVASVGLSLPAQASDSSVPAGHPHEGKRCHKKGKVVKVGNKYDRVKLKCTKVRRGDRHVKVWKYHGRA